MYSQAPLLAFMRAGKVPGETGVPKHIETVISNVFLFEDRVYKVYKNDNEFVNKTFADISTKEERFAFSRADFDWNHQLSKEVYLRLQPVKAGIDTVVFLDKDENAEELIFVTKRLPTGGVVFDQLREGRLMETDFYEIGKQFAQRESNFVLQDALPSESLLENMLGRYKDTIEWVKDVEIHVPQKEREMYLNQLRDLIVRVYEKDQTNISICIDFHSFNAFYVQHTLYPFDCFSPKYAWRFGPALLNIYRFATDVFALAGEKEFRAVMRGYYDDLNMEPVSGETERLLVIYAALIMVPYLYMLGRTDADKQEAADKYLGFLRRYAAA